MEVLKNLPAQKISQFTRKWREFYECDICHRIFDKLRDIEKHLDTPHSKKCANKCTKMELLERIVDENLLRGMPKYFKYSKYKVESSKWKLVQKAEKNRSFSITSEEDIFEEMNRNSPIFDGLPTP